MSNRRKIAIIGLVAVLVLVAVAGVSAKSTNKTLSTNFTLVNLATTANAGNILYFKQDPPGATWRDPDSFSFSALGDQAIFRQYTDPKLTTGEGSVVVGANAPVGAVVQIRALNQTPTSGAYSGATGGAAQVNIPLVARRGSSVSGTVNSQIIIQNTGTQNTNVEIALINRDTGAKTTTKSFANIPTGASVTYDLDDEANLPVGWFGSAVVRAAAGGQVTAVSNLFLGPNAMQTFNGFTKTSNKWIAPLFTSRLNNGLSTPITVQNLSGADIPVGGITALCKPNPASTVQQDLPLSNNVVVKNTAGFSWNPVVDNAIPAGFQGSCTISTGSAQTVAFVQMRFVGTDNAAAYEALDGNSTDTTSVIPLVLKRLPNGFATAVTISNFSDQATNVKLTYKGSAESPAGLKCSDTFNLTIPAGGSIVQNHRVTDDAVNSVPQIQSGCTSSLIVEPVDKANAKPIGAFVQITTYTAQSGDTFMAHDAFGVTVP